MTELMKLLPLGAASLGGSDDPRLQRSWLSSEYKRLRMLSAVYASPSSIADSELGSHRAWLANGAKGPGQLKLASRRLAREVYGAVDLTFVEMSRCDLHAADFVEARFEWALLEDNVLTFANVRAATFVSSRIRGGRWRSVNASGARFNEAEVTDTDFSRSDMEQSAWYDARVRGARFDGVRFGNTVFDRGTFEGCSFVDASFALFTSTPEPTSAGARFVDCDFTGTDWTGRNLEGTTFERCRGL